MSEIHYTDIEEWKWYYFTPEELACKGTGMIVVNPRAINCLNALRHIIGVPFTPNSAYRSEFHNKAVGGAPNSYHRRGMAFDIPILPGMEKSEIYRVGRLVGFNGFGSYDTFVHVDTGPEREWSD